MNTCICSACREELPIDSFNVYRNCPTGRLRYCRPCQKKREALYRETRKAYRNKLLRERYESEEGYRKHLNRFFKYTYGYTIEEYENLATKQENRCATCGEPPKEGSCLYVDHCHSTERVRGLLCFHCNTALCHFKDDPRILEAALSYLRKESAS